MNREKMWVKLENKKRRQLIVLLWTFSIDQAATDDREKLCEAENSRDDDESFPSVERDFSITWNMIGVQAREWKSVGGINGININ